jgi:hypothetical protein
MVMRSLGYGGWPGAVPELSPMSRFPRHVTISA